MVVNRCDYKNVGYNFQSEPRPGIQIIGRAPPGIEFATMRLALPIMTKQTWGDWMEHGCSMDLLSVFLIVHVFISYFIYLFIFDL